MLYYQGYTISFQEVPDEVSLVISIADCPYSCPGCHSPQLQKAEGKDLLKDIGQLIADNIDAITCVCFMGEGQDQESLKKCIEIARLNRLKTCVYTGRDSGWWDYPVEYYKTGPYIAERGGLDHETTNQVMRKADIVYYDRYCWSANHVENITKKFQKKKV